MASCDFLRSLQETKTNQVATECEKVLLYGQLPPIMKMDSALGTLKACKHLALSSNSIEKISGLKGLGMVLSHTLSLCVLIYNIVAHRVLHTVEAIPELVSTCF